MFKKIIYILSICFFFIFHFRCTESGTEPQENIILPESDLNFNDHIYPLFSAKCSSRNGCHTISDQRVFLIDYNAIITHFMTKAPSVKLIHEGDGKNSPLYQVLVQNGYLGVPRMPFNGPYLNMNQYEGVYTWIEEGAIPLANK